jgi:cyclopropane fatty-acyl-phospholipid synthase-like methyltransferase
MNGPCYNWDRSSWLSSKEYFAKLSNQLIKSLDLHEEIKILDVGCGRGYLLRSLANKANLINIPFGVEPVKHEGSIPHHIKIINSSINSFLDNNNIKFDVVILKQVLHLLNRNEREYFYYKVKKHLNDNAKIVFIHMNDQTEIPQFPIMKNRLKKSLNSHQYLLDELIKNFKLLKIDNFNYDVNISSKEYLEMIRNRYISVILDLNEEEIEKGIEFIKKHYPNQLSFKDTLTIQVFN